MKKNREELFRYESKKYFVTFFKTSCELISPNKQNLYHNNYKGFEISYNSELESDFEKNYGNPLCSLLRMNKLIVVEKETNKISIKIFYNRTLRKVGNPYFELSTNLTFLTYNFKTHDLYHGTITNYHKKRKFQKKLYRNQFWREPIQIVIDYIKSVLFPNQKENIDQITKHIIKIFFKNIPNSNIDDNLNPNEKIFKLRSDSIGVKLPDNWRIFHNIYPTPSKKLLRKYDFKYIEALQSFYGLNGDKFRKIFHQLTNINGKALESAVKCFGPEFIKNQNTSEVIKIINFDKHYDLSYSYVIDHFNKCNLSKQEISNFWKLFISSANGDIHYGSLLEHLNFIIKLKEFGENVKLRAKTENDFTEEHASFSSILQSYKNGFVYRFYNQDFINRVQIPIFDKENYYPIILTTTEEYNQESAVQSNCVRGYSDKASSVIISLRKGDPSSKERATIEYNCSKKSNKVILKNIQSLGRFNHELPDQWNYVLQKLDDRMKILGSSNVFTLPEMIVKFKNGKNTYSKAVFNKKGFVVWDCEYSENEEIMDLPI
jgi:hypothetical protein